MDNVQDVMTKVKFIASIRKDEKINVKHMTVQLNSLWTTLSRIFHQENRMHTLNFLVTTIQRAFDLLRTGLMHHAATAQSQADAFQLRDALSPTFCRHLAADLRACVPALANLRYTYEHDRIFACSLHTLQELMASKMAELEAQFPEAGLFPDLLMVAPSNKHKPTLAPATDPDPPSLSFSSVISTPSSAPVSNKIVSRSPSIV